MKEVSTYHIGLLGNMDATAIHEKILASEFSSSEAVKCAIERAKFADNYINAVVTADYSRATDLAKDINSGVFAGVPTFIKDLNDYKGLPTLKGSKGIHAKPAIKHDEVVEQILAVTGSIVLGKSATSEFGLLPCGETLQHGETRNPWNTEHSTGGSSAGAAALVASGVVPFAHASDGGGSIRIPASCCGLVGLKPSRGRNITSITKIAPIDIAEDGIVTRTVRDTANYYGQLEHYYANPQLPPIGRITHPGKKRLKIGLFTKSSLGVDSHGDVTETVLQSGKLCETLGHQVEYINNPFEHSVTRDVLVYWSFLSFASMLTEYASHGWNFNHFKTAKFTQQLGGFFPLISLKAISSFKNLKEHRHLYSELLTKYDVLLSPTLSHPAPLIGHFGVDVDALEIVVKLNSYVNFTTTQNVTGAPAISLPLGSSREGLPIGVQFAGKVGDEKTLLELAFEIEAAHPFKILERPSII